MKPTEQYFNVLVLLIMLYKVVLTLSPWMKPLCVTIRVEAHLYVVVYVMLYKVVLTFKTVDETLMCGLQTKAIEQYFYVVLFIMLCNVVLPFYSADETLVYIHLK